MKKKLIKHGNSSALVIDKALLSILKINQDTILDISTDGNSIIITPVKAENEINEKVSEKEKIRKAFLDVMKQYGPALKKLAKH